MHGFGPRVLQVLPREGRGATVAEIRARIGDLQERVPSAETIRRHLATLEVMSLVYREPGKSRAEPARYFRLVESVFDEPVGVEA